MRAIDYRNILNENLQASANKMGLGNDFVFQQDNDPKHTPKLVKTYFEDNDITVLEWPANSPDLNPIEHIGRYLERKVVRNSVKSKAELKRRILQEWNKIEPSFIKKLVESMLKRLASVINAKGGHAKY